MPHLTPYYHHTGRALQLARIRECELEKLAEEIVTLGDPQPIHYEVCHRNFPRRPRSASLQRRIEDTRRRIHDTRVLNRQQYMARRTEVIVDEAMADVHARLGQLSYQRNREHRWDSDHTDCEVCRRVFSTRYSFLESIPLHTGIVGYEEPQEIGTTFETQSHNLEYVYFGNMQDLTTGQFIATDTICPVDELSLADFHIRHGEVQDVDAYYKLQIQCDIRTKHAHDSSEILHSEDGRSNGIVNWEHRVCDFRNLTAYCNRIYSQSQAETNTWRCLDFNTTGTGASTNYVTTTTANTTSGTLDLQVPITYIPWQASDESTMLIQRTRDLMIDEGGFMSQGWRHARTPSIEPITRRNRGVEDHVLQHHLGTLFVKVPKKTYKKLTKEQKLLVKAKNKSEQLLKQWMSADEYRALKNLGQVEIKHLSDPDVIFIIKIDPQQQVQVKVKGEIEEQWCVVPTDTKMPIGDQLLSKYLQLKHNPEYFMKTAVRHNFKTGAKIIGMTPIRKHRMVREDGRKLAVLEHMVYNRSRGGLLRRGED